MHVVRRLGASEARTTSTRLPSLEQTRAARGYYAPTPGDVRVRQPAPPPPATPTSKQTTPTTQPTGQPDLTSVCNTLWNQLIAKAPPYVQACLADARHKRVFDGICAKMAGQQITLAAGAAQWAGYVEQNCPPPTQTPQTPPAVPPAQPPPPPTSTPTVPTSSPTQPPMDMPGGGSPGGAGRPAEEAGYLRQVGSIVGIGLILAVGLTYARKKGMLRKLTKRRARR